MVRVLSSEAIPDGMFMLWSQPALHDVKVDIDRACELRLTAIYEVLPAVLVEVKRAETGRSMLAMLMDAVETSGKIAVWYASEFPQRTCDALMRLPLFVRREENILYFTNGATVEFVKSHPAPRAVAGFWDEAANVIDEDKEFSESDFEAIKSWKLYGGRSSGMSLPVHLEGKFTDGPDA